MLQFKVSCMNTLQSVTTLPHTRASVRVIVSDYLQLLRNDEVLMLRESDERVSNNNTSSENVNQFLKYDPCSFYVRIKATTKE